MKITKKIFYRSWIASMLVFVSFSCSNNNSSDGSPQEEEPGIKITASRTNVAVDGELQLTAQVTPDNATNNVVSWSSDNEAVAEVDAVSGLVTGKQPGEVTITAISQGDPSISGSIDLRIVHPVTSLNIAIDDEIGTAPEEGIDITVEKALPHLATNPSRLLAVTVGPTEATIKGINFSFDEETGGSVSYEIVETDETTGEVILKIEGDTPGVVTLTATAEDGLGATDDIVIRVTQDDYVVTVQGDNFEIRPLKEDDVLVSLMDYEYDVDWDNDGIFDDLEITGNITAPAEKNGTYTIRISGTYPNPSLSDHAQENESVVSVDQWGTQSWLSMLGSFFKYVNLEVEATDIPDLSQVKNMAQMFEGASSADPDVSDWDISIILVDAFNLFKCSKISVINYENALISFSNQVDNNNSPKDIALGEVPVEAQSQEAIAARNNLINNHGWTINDGVECNP